MVEIAAGALRGLEAGDLVRTRSTESYAAEKTARPAPITMTEGRRAAGAGAGAEAWARAQPAGHAGSRAPR